MKTKPLLMLSIWAMAASGLASSEDVMNKPDAHAWELFVRINAAIPNDPDGRVQWEGWALARDVFADPNKKPDWDALTGGKRTIQNFDPLPLQQLFILQAKQGLADLSEADKMINRPLFDRPSALQQGNETRMNRATFDFIVTNNLYYVEGQEQAFTQHKVISFPPEAMEVKAQWRKIDPKDAAQFHVAKVKIGSEEETWGLTALHITTKEVPNWFWATFEHKSNPRREVIIPSRDSSGLPPALKNTKWENYVLRGSQVDFTSSTGIPTLLANSQIEEGFENSSSCISCHARSTIGPRTGTITNRLTIFESMNPVTSSNGAPKSEWFFDRDPQGKLTAKYTQLDFVWSLFRAKRKGP